MRRWPLTSLLGTPQLYLPSAFAGEVLISVPVRNTGVACNVEVNLYIYEGSWLPGHGTLLAHYTQDVRFEEGEDKEVVFAHSVIQTGQGRRDIGVEVVAGGLVAASVEFDDVYSVSTAMEEVMGGITAMLPLMAMMGMMMMLSPMMEGGQL